MAITTADKRRLLEDAWDATVISRLTLRDQLRSLETLQGKTVAGGSLSSVSANGRNSQFAPYGPGQTTPVEMAQAYRELIDLFDQSAKWLRACLAGNVDAWNAELQGSSDASGTWASDTTGKWQEGCSQFNVDSTTVIGAATVIDDAVFIWMMDHLFPVTEARSDYGQLMTAAGGWV